MESEATAEEIAKTAQHLLRSGKLDYTNDGIYGAALMLASHLEDDLTVEEALNEFIRNSETKLEIAVSEP